MTTATSPTTTKLRTTSNRIMYFPLTQDLNELNESIRKTYLPLLEKFYRLFDCIPFFLFSYHYLPPESLQLCLGNTKRCFYTVLIRKYVPNCRRQAAYLRGFLFVWSNAFAYGQNY